MVGHLDGRRAADACQCLGHALRTPLEEMGRQAEHPDSPSGKEQTVATGTVKKIVRERGFGFIQGDDGVQLFFHRSAVEGSG